MTRDIMEYDVVIVGAGPSGLSAAIRFKQLCIKNNKKCDFSYMTFTSDSLPKIRKDFIATLHPSDNTMRIQSVKKDMSPSFHRLLSLFNKKSGLPGVLNTSLNIHGKPIIQKPIDIVNELLKVPEISINNIIVDKYFFKLK